MASPQNITCNGESALAARRAMHQKVITFPAATHDVGFRYGPKSFIATDTKVFVFLSNHALTGQYDRDLAAEVREQFRPNVALSLGEGGETDLPRVGNDAADAVLYVLFAQALAVVWSHDLGVNIDDPFKGRGTLTRVVSGVTLHTPEAL